MAHPVQFGIDGIELQLGDHLCGLFFGRQQRDAVLLPFLRAGLQRGEKCICVVDGTEPAEIVSALGSDLGGPPSLTPKQLEVMRSTDIYLRSGKFTASEIISSWKAAISEVMYEARFPVVRAIETWSLRDVLPDTQELLTLESQMNHFLPLYPQVIVCLYDLERFGGGIVVDLLKTHSLMLVGGMVVENPYSLSPEELLAIRAGVAPDRQEREREEAAEWYYAATTG